MADITVHDIIKTIEEFAPIAIQESYDNCGLQVGNSIAIVSGVLLCIDVTEAVVEEAIERNANLIISHHPLLFKGIKSITGISYIEKVIIKAIQNNIAIYASHTCMDNASNGVSWKMAEKIGLVNMSVLEPLSGQLLKLKTYIPEKYADKIKNILFSAGAGHIGKYDQCSFNYIGQGTFRAGEGSTPFCEEINQLHTEQETCIEVILPAYLRRNVIEALLQAHPYEEPAFDIIPLQNRWNNTGAGIIGELTTEMDEISFLRHIKTTFQVPVLKHSPFQNKPIKKVALCGGSGALLISTAMGKKADVYITGEIKYHDYFGYESQMLLAEIGHYESEQYTKELFYDIITKKFPTFAPYYSKVDTNPINYL